MFKRTRRVISEIWARSTVTVDPMPLPGRYLAQDIKDISKALVEDLKEAWQQQHRLIA